jgi:hypothetical protein
MITSPIIEADNAQEFLVPYLQQSEQRLKSALRELDSTSECQIVPAADLCFPHDVIRIAGGFATGCVVEWRCSVPIIPVDTTVNIDTTSVFWLSDDISSQVDEDQFTRLQKHIETESSYMWNFHKGNHFITFFRSRASGRPALVIHSNEKEFKYQFNGLMPVEGNWFMDSVKTFRYGDSSYIRLLIGPKAILFAEIASMLERYNIDRHRFIATVLLNSRCEVAEEYHKHHYYMPTSSSVAIGCFLCEEGETVPIFSQPGKDIHLFQATGGGNNKFRSLLGSEFLLVPHGWGKTAAGPAHVSSNGKQFTINDLTFDIKPQVSLGTHPGLIWRDFDEDPNSPNSLFKRMSHHTPGTVVDSLFQICGYCRGGFRRYGD